MDMSRFAVSLLVLCSLIGTARADDVIGAAYVETEPAGAAVYVNGDLKGISPCGVPNLAIGEVTVGARLQGFEDGTQKVTIEGGKTARVAIKLVAIDGVGAIAVLIDPPGSRIQLDRIQVDDTPAVLRNVKAGTHRLVVSAEGYRPHVASVTVVEGRTVQVSGDLATAGVGRTTGILPQDIETMGVVDPDDVPAADSMPEEKALVGIHRMLQKRDYEGALKGLDRLARDETTLPYSRRVARERTYAERLRAIMAQAVAELNGMVGQDVALELGAGIGIRGTLVGVADGMFTLDRDGRQTSFDVDSLSTEQVVDLASKRLPADQPVNAVGYALLHATEGDFTTAYEWLRRAARQGYDITVARSHIDSRHLWLLASEKAASGSAQADGPSAEGKLELAIGPPVTILLDTFHGAGLPADLRKELQERNFHIKVIDRELADADIAEPTLLMIRDPGPNREVPAYTPAERQRIVDFLIEGGGLVFFGCARPAAREEGGASAFGPPSPFAAMLRPMGIVPRSDLLMMKDVPEGQPDTAVLGVPARGPGLTARLRAITFPRATPSLEVARKEFALVRGAPWVNSLPAEEQAPVLVAARQANRGRIVIFAQLPLTGDSPWGADRESANDGALLLVRTLRWAAEPFAKSTSPK